jgi:hypothetical protein
MRLATKRFALPIAIAAALAVTVPAIPAAAQTDDGATASQRSKDPRDRGGRENPRCRIVERQQESAKARVSSSQQKLKAAKKKLKNARAAAAEAEGKKAKAQAAKKVKKAKKKVANAKKALKSAKAQQRDANQDAERYGCGG